MDRSAVLFGFYDFRNAKVMILDELFIEKSKMTPKVLGDMIKEKELLYTFTPDKVLRRGDTNEQYLIRDLSITQHLPFGLISKSSLSAMVANVRDWFGQGRIVIHPRCIWLIDTLKSAVWASDARKEFGHSAVLGHYDMFASLMYLLRCIDQQTNPIPFETTIGPNTFVHPNSEQQYKSKRSDTAESIRKLLSDRWGDNNF